MEDYIISTTRTKTLFQYVIPAILTNACIFLSTYVTYVATPFVIGKFSSEAVGGLYTARQLVSIATGVSMFISTGGVTVAAIRLGRGEKEGANQVFMHSLSANLIFALITTILCVFFTEPVARMLGADGSLIPFTKDTKDFIFWWGIFAIPYALFLNFQSFCRNDGSPILAFSATALSTILNIVLSWLFISPLQMGIMGIALAMGISQTVSMMIVLMHFISEKGELRIHRFKPEGKIFRKVLFRGLPQMIAQFATPVTTLCIHLVSIGQAGSKELVAFSIISSITSLAMPVLSGTSEGLQPLFGQSYGAKKEQDLQYYFRSGIIICIVGSISTLAIRVYLVLKTPLLSLWFGVSGEMLIYTIKYLLPVVWACIIAGINTLISVYLYSTKRSVHAIVLNVARSFVLNTIIITGLPVLFGKNIVRFTFGISECVVLILAIILLRISERNRSA